MPPHMSDCLCDRCAGLCCRYFALPIDNPETRRDYDNIRWYLLHEKVVVFVEDAQWFIGILNKCKALQPDNRCGVYETRPQICRGYSTDNCDYHGGDYGYDRLFTSADALWTFAQEQLERDKQERKDKKRRKAKQGSRRAAIARRLAEGRPLILPPPTGPTGPVVSVNGKGRSVSLPVAGG